MTNKTNYWLNGIMGVVVGDALGCPVQFESRKEVATHPVTGMRGYGTFNLPEGSWTDTNTGKVYEGGKAYTVPAPIEYIPVFVKTECKDIFGI